jgi:hypothetical protein
MTEPFAGFPPEGPDDTSLSRLVTISQQKSVTGPATCKPIPLVTRQSGRPA